MGNISILTMAEKTIKHCQHTRSQEQEVGGEISQQSLEDRKCFYPHSNDQRVRVTATIHNLKLYTLQYYYYYYHYCYYY